MNEQGISVTSSMVRVPRSAWLPIGIGSSLLAVAGGIVLSIFGTTPQTQWMEPLALLILLFGCPSLVCALALAAARVWKREGILRLLAIPLATLAIPALLYFVLILLILAGVVHLF